MCVACRGTETNVTDGFGSDLLTDVRAVRSSIRDMKGLPAGTLDAPKYKDMMVGLGEGGGVGGGGERGGVGRS